jgi:hypothetical protein
MQHSRHTPFSNIFEPFECTARFVDVIRPSNSARLMLFTIEQLLMRFHFRLSLWSLCNSTFHMTPSAITSHLLLYTYSLLASPFESLPSLTTLWSFVRAHLVCSCIYSELHLQLHLQRASFLQQAPSASAKYSFSFSFSFSYSSSIEQLHLAAPSSSSI